MHKATAIVFEFSFVSRNTTFASTLYSLSFLKPTHICASDFQVLTSTFYAFNL